MLPGLGGSDEGCRNIFPSFVDQRPTRTEYANADKPGSIQQAVECTVLLLCFSIKGHLHGRRLEVAGAGRRAIQCRLLGPGRFE